jgi:phage terminase large subunit
MLRDATQYTLFEILGRNEIPYDLHKAENLVVLKDTRSKIIFRAVEEFERLRGTNLAWFGLDELTYTDENAWLRLEGRLRDPKASRLCGFAVWTPRGFDWVYRRFIRERVDGYEVTLAPPFENRFLTAKVPDYYERLKRSYDPRFYEQEVLGKYLNVREGLVYYAFERTRNITDVTVDPRLPLLWAMDFNVDPMSSVVAQKQDDRLYVIDEIAMSRVSTTEACEEFQNRFPRHTSGVVTYGDATGSRMQTTGSSDHQMVKRYFESAGYGSAVLRFAKSNPPVEERVKLMNCVLRSANGEARLLVNRKCVQLIQDFEEVTYKAGGSLIDKDKDPKRTHLSDALGYLAWEELRRKAVAGEQGMRVV